MEPNFIDRIWEKIHGQHRKPDQTLHGGPADAASAADNGASAGTTPLSTGGIPIATGGTGAIPGTDQPDTGIGFGGSSISAYMQQLAQAHQNAIDQKAWGALQNAAQAQNGHGPFITSTSVWGTPVRATFSPVDGVVSTPLKHEGIRLGELTAWRCWRLEAGFLRAVFVGSIWAPGEPMQGIVGENLSSGVHAWNSERGSIEYGTNFCRISDPSSIIVFGRVALWGDIIEYELGYRAEYGRVIGLDYMNGSAKFSLGFLTGTNELEALRERYGVKGK